MHTNNMTRVNEDAKRRKKKKSKSGLFLYQGHYSKTTFIVCSLSITVRSCTFSCGWILTWACKHRRAHTHTQCTSYKLVSATSNVNLGKKVAENKLDKAWNTEHCFTKMKAGYKPSTNCCSRPLPSIAICFFLFSYKKVLFFLFFPPQLCQPCVAGGLMCWLS